MFEVTGVFGFHLSCVQTPILPFDFQQWQHSIFVLRKKALRSSPAVPCRKGSISKASEAFFPLRRVEIPCTHILLGGESCKTGRKLCHWLIGYCVTGFSCIVCDYGIIKKNHSASIVSKCMYISYFHTQLSKLACWDLEGQTTRWVKI